MHIPYSFKSIPLPNKNEYKLLLRKKNESFILNMRQKAYISLQTIPRLNLKNTEFKTNNHPIKIRYF